MKYKYLLFLISILALNFQSLAFAEEVRFSCFNRSGPKTRMSEEKFAKTIERVYLKLSPDGDTRVANALDVPRELWSKYFWPGPGDQLLCFNRSEYCGARKAKRMAVGKDELDHIWMGWFFFEETNGPEGYESFNGVVASLPKSLSATSVKNENKGNSIEMSKNKLSEKDVNKFLKGLKDSEKYLSELVINNSLRLVKEKFEFVELRGLEFDRGSGSIFIYKIGNVKKVLNGFSFWQYFRIGGECFVVLDGTQAKGYVGGAYREIFKVGEKELISKGSFSEAYD